MSVREGARISGSVIAIFAVVMVIAMGIGAMWIFGWGWFQRSTADFRGKTGQIEQVHGDPNYRIAAYDHFFDLCAAVQTTEASIQALEDERNDTTNPPTTSRQSQISTNLTALRASRAGLINQYNADAHKADTKANFLASDLPFQLDSKAEETSCTAPTP